MPCPAYQCSPAAFSLLPSVPPSSISRLHRAQIGITSRAQSVGSTSAGRPLVGVTYNYGAMMWRRIAVYGPTGSGKTVTARLIGGRLSLPVIELDALFWGPHRQQTPDGEFRSRVLEALGNCTEGWVCDGSYMSKVGDIVLPEAELVIWLRPSFVVAYWRLLRRIVRRAWTRESLWGTNQESWRQTFMSRDSALLVAITRWRQHSVKIATGLQEIPHEATVKVLRTKRDVRALLDSLR
jgi:adenylate kinase family enzyme